jgi:hypothetical protein
MSKEPFSILFSGLFAFGEFSTSACSKASFLDARLNVAFFSVQDVLEKPRKIQQVYQCEIELVRVGEMCVI